MTEQEIEDFLNKVETGLAEAQHNMLVEKALHNQYLIITDKKGKVVRVPAKQLLEEEQSKAQVAQ